MLLKYLMQQVSHYKNIRLRKLEYKNNYSLLVLNKKFLNSKQFVNCKMYISTELNGTMCNVKK